MYFFATTTIREIYDHETNIKTLSRLLHFYKNIFYLVEMPTLFGGLFLLF